MGRAVFYINVSIVRDFPALRTIDYVKVASNQHLFSEYILAMVSITTSQNIISIRVAAAMILNFFRKENDEELEDG